MHVVVTGSAGFLGRHVVHALVRRGDRVTAVDRRRDAGHVAAGGAGHGRTPTVTTVTEDLTAPGGGWRAQAARADAVVHLAARSGVRDAGPGVERDRERDVLGSALAVLDATPPGVPLVVASSSAVYGEAPAGRGSREDDPLRPVGSYGRWKVAVERACAGRRDAGGIVSVARPFTVAGPGQRPDMAVSRWLDAVLSGRPVHVLGGLDRERDVSDVADVTDGLLALVDAGVAGGLSCTVNLGPGTPVSHADVLESLARVTGRDLDVRVGPAHPGEVRRTHADPARARRLLGLRPRTDLDDLLARQLAARAAPAAA